MRIRQDFWPYKRPNVNINSNRQPKVGKSIFQSKIQIDNYDLLGCDRNRNGGGFTRYIRSDIGFVQKDFFPHIFENIFFEILLPKTTPITVGIMYRPRSQTNFPGIWNMTIEKVDLDKKDVYTLGNFSINMYHNNKYVVEMITRFL